ncbi:MAG: hypothetical protein IMZ50_06640 [Candidatus Atribacteria bacterium]|nr:hypothetical protein [Candidatus Atribacteria bacterium]
MSTATATKRSSISATSGDGRRVTLHGGDGDDDNSMLERLKLAQAALAQKTQQAGQIVTPQYRGMMQQPQPSADPNAVTPQYRQPMGLVQPQVAPHPSASPLATQADSLRRELGQGYAKDAAGNVTYQGQPSQTAPQAPQTPATGSTIANSTLATRETGYGWTAPAPAAPPVDPLKAEADKLAQDMGIRAKIARGDPEAIAEGARRGWLSDPAMKAIALKGMDVQSRSAIATGGREVAEKRIIATKEQNTARLDLMESMATASRALTKGLAEARETGMTARHTEDLGIAKSKLKQGEDALESKKLDRTARGTLAGELNALRMAIANMEASQSVSRQNTQRLIQSARTNVAIPQLPAPTPVVPAPAERTFAPADFPPYEAPPAPQASQGASLPPGQAPAPTPAAGAGAMPGAPQGQPPPMPPYEFQAQVGVVYVNPKGTKLRRTAQGWEIVP